MQSSYDSQSSYDRFCCVTNMTFIISFTIYFVNSFNNLRWSHLSAVFILGINYTILYMQFCWEPIGGAAIKLTNFINCMGYHLCPAFLIQQLQLNQIDYANYWKGQKSANKLLE